MCYSIPGKVLSVEGSVVTLDYFGERRTASNPARIPVKPGIYVYAQGGIIVDTVPEKEALETLALWEGKFAGLKQRDAELSRARAEGGLHGIIEKAQGGGTLTNADMRRVLAEEDGESLQQLYSAANSVRSKSIQNACCVHGIIEFSNYCMNDCRYCGINRYNTGVRRYRMSPEEIIAVAEHAVKELGFRALVLQSGEDFHYTDDMLVDIVKRIRERCGVLLFMSIGERSAECYKRLYEAGAYGALLRFETSNEKLYAAMHGAPPAGHRKRETGHATRDTGNRELKPRLALIRELKKLGFVLATGFILGLPGQTEQDVINDVLLTKAISPDMYSFGPLVPHPSTPLADARKPSLEEVLKVTALARLADPGCHMVATSATETLAPDAAERCLMAGANSLMINATPKKYRCDYDLYPGKAGKDELQDRISRTLGLLHSLGRAPTDLR